MPKKVSSKRGNSSSINNTDASLKISKRYSLSTAVRESHGHPIYCVAFSPHVHIMDDDDDSNANTTTGSYFATVGGSYATIYEVINNDTSKALPIQTQPLTARQIYKDVDDGELFYTCAFGGRGVGTPIGYGAVGIVAEEESNDTSTSGKKKSSNSHDKSIIYFGEKKQQKEQHNSKKPVKRQKQHDTHKNEIDTKESQQCQFFLPHYATQNGPPLLCLGGTRGIIKVIDTCRRSLFMTLSGHGNDITDLKFSPANEWLLLSASKDETIRLWNLQRGVCVAVFTGHNAHRGQALSVSWHLTGSKFVSCGMDNMIKLWRVYDDDNTDDNKEKRKCGPVEKALRNSQNVVPNGCISSDKNKKIDDGQDRALETTKFETYFQQFPYFSTNKAHINYVDCVQFVGDLILSKSIDNKVVLWKPIFDNDADQRLVYTTNRVPSDILYLREFQLENCGSWFIRFESPPPYHHLLALGNQVGEVKVWHIGNDEKHQKYFCNLTTSNGWFGTTGKAVNDQTTIRMVAFNPHGSSLVAVKDDSTVWMWDVAMK